MVAMRPCLLAGLGAVALAGKGQVNIGASAGSGLGSSKLPFGLSPSATKDFDFDLFDAKVSVGGAYDFSELRFAPSEVSVGAARPGVRARVVLGNPIGPDPDVTATATFGDVASGDYVALTVDSTEPTPALLEGARVRVPRTKITLSPKWAPRAEGLEGLSVDVSAPLRADSDRAVLDATLRPRTRPSVKFHFGLDKDATLDITPLLGANGTSTKWELERRGLVDALGRGVAAKATFLDKTLTLLAKIPIAGTRVVPSMTVALDSLTKPTFALKQSFSF